MEKKNAHNNVIETIMNRRGIRSYKSEQITDEELELLLWCGINAPSALNKQPWEIRVVQNPMILKTINDSFIEYAKNKDLPGSASKAQEPGFSVFHNAPTLIMIAHYEANPYSLVDCGLLGQNILLAAESMNIGTCVLGTVAGYLNIPWAQKEIVSQLGFSDGYKLIYAIAAGYKNQSPDAKPRDESKVQILR